MREVFLSHASQDHDAAGRLRSLLLAHRIPVWFSAHHIQGAQQWQDEIGAALARCRWFMILLTPHAVKSMWVKRELNYALSEKRYENRIVPLLLRPCDFRALSWTLPQIQLIDLTGDFWPAFEKLLAVWRKRLQADVQERFGPHGLSRRKRTT
jgi:hypothetical protein